MNKKYKQLSREQRYQIHALLKEGYLQKDIAQNLGVHPSTICRELKRNVGKRGRRAGEYLPERAHCKAVLRHKTKPKKIKFTKEMKDMVSWYLKEERGSPELISHAVDQVEVSHETIYRWIWECKHSFSRSCRPYKNLYRYLRHGKRKRKRGCSYDRRGNTPDRVFIDQRPVAASKRSRIVLGTGK
ncbi:MAG: helix-turn-helix domain-containing protein [Bacteroidia bacterium]|nr:helix-turn-helix domain-containing protein [Bacteroidia bacterium]